MNPILERFLLLLAGLLRKQIEAHAAGRAPGPQWPAPGRIVLYHLGAGEWAEGRGPKVLPAMITAAHSAECANLTVFPDDNKGLFRKTSVQISESGGPQPGRWSWPPRKGAG